MAKKQEEVQEDSPKVCLEYFLTTIASTEVRGGFRSHAGNQMHDVRTMEDWTDQLNNWLNSPA